MTLSERVLILTQPADTCRVERYLAEEYQCNLKYAVWTRQPDASSSYGGFTFQASNRIVTVCTASRAGKKLA
jgi:hypothetical protein